MAFDLIIAEQNDEAFLRKNMKKIGIRSNRAFKGDNMALRFLRRVWFKYNLPKKDFWYNEEIIKEKFSNILLFDSLLTIDFIRWLRKNQPESRIVLFYSNIVKSSLNPDLIENTLCEKWSFEKVDCEKYDLKYNSGYYFSSLKVENISSKYEVLFVGRDKGRYNYLHSIKNRLEEAGIVTHFRIVPNRNFLNITGKTYKREIVYDDILDLISKSNCILDIVQGGQTGTTLRVMESIFNKKKLITNNKAIKNLKIYNSNNIFVIDGAINASDIKIFLNLPYVDICNAEIVYYDFKNWLSRFFE